jgi:CRISPR type III-A-associated protein Csm2
MSYVDGAKQLIKDNKKEDNFGNIKFFLVNTNKNPKGKPKWSDLSYTQVRNILSLVSPIFDESEMLAEINDSIQSKLDYLRVKLAYSSSRDAAVKKFVTECKIDEKIVAIKDLKDVKEFCRYMESLVAFLKWYGIRDN